MPVPDKSITVTVFDCPNCGRHMNHIVHSGTCKVDATERTYVAVDALRLDHRAMNEIARLWNEPMMYTNGARNYDAQRVDRILAAIVNRLTGNEVQS